MDATFYKEHPEMLEGTFEVAFLAEGVALLRRVEIGARKSSGVEEADDPMVGAYLAWQEQLLRRQPSLIEPLTDAEFQRAIMLTEGVSVDLEHDRLPEGFELP